MTQAMTMRASAKMLSIAGRPLAQIPRASTGLAIVSSNHVRASSTTSSPTCSSSSTQTSGNASRVPTSPFSLPPSSQAKFSGSTKGLWFSVGSAAVLTGTCYLANQEPSQAEASKAQSHIPILPSGGLFSFIQRRFLSMAHCQEEQPPAATARISRLMLPDDANPAGNVHGGTILHLIDQAGWAAATKYFNTANGTTKSPEKQQEAGEGDQEAKKDDHHGRTTQAQAGVASLARIERVEFHQPMFIGEVSQVESEVTYTSPHTIEVKVVVCAENVLTGKTRITNTAHAWYVVKEHRPDVAHLTSVLQRHNTHGQYANAPVLPVPALAPISEEKERVGREHYEHQQQERLTRAEAEASHPMTSSQATLIHLLLPSDCHSNGVAQAGAVLKLMDTAAGIVSVKHCRSNVVTASLEAVDFLHPVFNGDLLEIHAYPVFNSKRSMDVEVNVFTIDHLTSEKRLATRSIFTFVSLDETYKPKDVPPIEIETEAQRVRWEAREEKYRKRKVERMKQKERQRKQQEAAAKETGKAQQEKEVDVQQTQQVDKQAKVVKQDE